MDIQIYMQTRYVNQSMPVEILPAALKALVKMTGKRPARVVLFVCVGPMPIHANYAVDRVVSLGELVSEVDASYIGSDSESNKVVDLTYSAPAAAVYRKSVCLVVSNVSVELVDALVKGMTPELLSVAVDQSLEG